MRTMPMLACSDAHVSPVTWERAFPAADKAPTSTSPSLILGSYSPWHILLLLLSLIPYISKQLHLHSNFPQSHFPVLHIFFAFAINSSLKQDLPRYPPRIAMQQLTQT
jgi:hypothetical protein